MEWEDVQSVSTVTNLSERRGGRRIMRMWRGRRGGTWGRSEGTWATGEERGPRGEEKVAKQ